MLEFLSNSLNAVTSWPNKKEELKKIEAIFTAAEFGMKKNGELTIPSFRNKKPLYNEKKLVGMEYWFALPLGMSSSRITKFTEDNALGVGLQKTVRVIMDEYLKVKVFDHKIPQLVEYRDMPAKEGWRIPVGEGCDHIIWHDFDHTPHMIVSGVTRFGKSVFLKNILTYLIERHPDETEAYIIDLKGGLEFGPYEHLQQIKKVVDDPAKTALLLEQITEQIQQDFAMFRQNQWTNILDTPIKKRKFIIVDEAANLTPEKWMDKETKALLNFCQSKLCEIARVGGAVGYRLVYCTQYPTKDTVPRQIKVNADAKLSFRLSDSTASKVAIDATGAESLPDDFRGRALYKTHKVQEVQTPLLEEKEMKERLEKYFRMP